MHYSALSSLVYSTRSFTLLTFATVALFHALAGPMTHRPESRLETPGEIIRMADTTASGALPTTTSASASTSAGAGAGASAATNLAAAARISSDTPTKHKCASALSTPLSPPRALTAGADGVLLEGYLRVERDGDTGDQLWFKLRVGDVAING